MEDREHFVVAILIFPINARLKEMEMLGNRKEGAVIDCLLVTWHIPSLYHLSYF